MPSGLSLGQNYSNPFNPATLVALEFLAATHVSLVVYDMKGRAVAKLMDGHLPAGRHKTVWTGHDLRGRPLPTAIYISRLVTLAYARNIIMVLLK